MSNPRYCIVSCMNSHFSSLSLVWFSWQTAKDSPTLVPAAGDPAVLSEESSETVLESDLSRVSVDVLEPSPVASRESVDLLDSSPVASKESVDLVEPLPVASLGLQSSGSYLLCLSCSFLLVISASLSTFCSSLALQYSRNTELKFPWSKINAV